MPSGQPLSPYSHPQRGTGPLLLLIATNGHYIISSRAKALNEPAWKGGRAPCAHLRCVHRPHRRG